MTIKPLAFSGGGFSCFKDISHRRKWPFTRNLPIKKDPKWSENHQKRTLSIKSDRLFVAYLLPISFPFVSYLRAKKDGAEAPPSLYDEQHTTNLNE